PLFISCNGTGLIEPIPSTNGKGIDIHKISKISASGYLEAISCLHKPVGIDLVTTTNGEVKTKLTIRKIFQQVVDLWPSLDVELIGNLIFEHHRNVQRG